MDCKSSIYSLKWTSYLNCIFFELVHPCIFCQVVLFRNRELFLKNVVICFEISVFQHVFIIK